MGDGKLRLILLCTVFLLVCPAVSAQEVTEDTGAESAADTRYTASGLLSQETVCDENGAELYTDFFRYTRDNRLRSIVRRYPDGTKEKTSVLSRNGKINLMRMASEKPDDSSLLLLEYDAYSRIAGETLFNGEQETSVRRYAYAGNSGKPFSIMETESDTVSQSVLDDSGKIIRTSQTAAGNKLMEEVFYTYDESDRVAAKKVIRYTWQIQDDKTFELKFDPETDVLLYEFVYDEDGSVSEETYTKNNVIQSVTSYDGADCISELFYRNGEPFLKVFFSENKKVKEEYYRGGKTAGIRIFK